MFGQNKSQQATIGTPVVQNPSMLDNVSTNDDTTVDENEKSSQLFSTAQRNYNSQDVSQYSTQNQPQPIMEHQITTDNPFIRQPQAIAKSAFSTNDINDNVASTTATTSTPTAFSTTPTSTTASLATSNSGPVNPPADPVAQTVVTNNDDTDYAETSEVKETSEDKESTDLQENTEGINEDTQSTETVDEAEYVSAVDKDKLAEMKQQALEHLEPLVKHLEQTPEETFKTTMMMIQANDNHTLLEKALESAKKIKDDKLRAKAMLDLINEINYFSQNN